MLRKCFIVAVVIVFVYSSNAFSELETKELLFEDFELERKSGLYAMLAGKKYLSIVGIEGVDGSMGLKATYVSGEMGSERLVARYPLPEFSDEMTLVYDVKFDQDFRFVKGGKLHGLGPSEPITGGKKMIPSGWSARVLFKRQGGIGSYLYTQDKNNKYGVEKTNRNFRFEKERYYSVSFHIRINDVGESNGYAHIYVDGHKLVEQNEVRFRAVGGKGSSINELLFNTFHGGNNSDWAPKNDQGEYLNVHAYFDNIAVYRGKYIRFQAGQ